MSQCSTSLSEILLGKIAEGDRQALDELLAKYRPYVRRVVDARLEPRLRSRVDPSDVVQDTLLAASRRIDDFLTRRPASFGHWMYGETMKRLANTRRRHYAKKRDLLRETPVDSLSAVSIAGSLLGKRASEVLRKKEQLTKVVAAIEEIAETDREILLLRNVDGLSNAEIAEILEVKPSTASLRYGRALRRLRNVLKKFEV